MRYCRPPLDNDSRGLYHALAGGIGTSKLEPSFP